MIPMINDFMDAYNLDDVVVVADAGMISAANKQALERAGLSYVLGSRTSLVPHVISSWRDSHPDQDVPDGLTLTQPWPAGPSDQRRDETIYYRYSADRARRTLRGIDTQVAKAEKAVAGKIPVKRNRFVHLDCWGFFGQCLFVFQAAFFRPKNSLSTSSGVRYPRAE